MIYPARIIFVTSVILNHVKSVVLVKDTSLDAKILNVTQIQLVDYEINLSSGGRISIVELDPERIPELLNQSVFNACWGILERCTFSSRATLEEAKKGYDRELLKLLRAPEGGLLRASPSVCRLIQDCAMAIPTACTLKNLKKGKAKFPQCWEYRPPDGIQEEVRRAAIGIGTFIGSAWRDGSYPIIVNCVKKLTPVLP